MSDRWATVALGDVTSKIGSGATPRGGTNAYQSSGTPLIRSTNVRFGYVRTSDLVFLDDAQAKALDGVTVETGDVLLNITGASIGRVSECPPSLAGARVNQHVSIIRATEVLEGRFLHYFFRSPAQQSKILESESGATRQALTKGKLASWTVPLPPLDEQRRIVAKIDALMARSRQAKESLDAIPPLLERLRQSILAAAFRGDLTADWRAQNPDVEPAEKLLERIRTERRRRWEKATLEKMRAKGKAPTGDGWKAKYEEPAIQSRPTDLPPTWSWAPLAMLGSDPLAAVQTGPFGAQLHSDEFVSHGVPVIAVGNLTGSGFSDEGLYYVTHDKAQQLSKYDVSSGDVLFARSGATLGKVCVAPRHVHDWRMTGHILRVRLRQEISPQIVTSAIFGMPSVKSQIARKIRGATRPGFNTSLLEEICVPLIPVAEQQLLVARLDAALQRVADIEQAHHGELMRATDLLERAILAKAFRGELVPQDPNDEPAEQMLARLASTESPAKTKRGRTRKQDA